jgi:hypothetical protein
MWSVAGTMTSTNANFFFTEAWLVIVENHRLMLINDKNTNMTPITPYDLEVYKGDIFGFLTFKTIPHYLHWTICRMNGIYSTEQFNHNYKYLYVPAESAIENLRKLAMTTT